MRVRAYETGPGFSLESLFAGEMIKRSRRSGATVLDQQIELVAKLFNGGFPGRLEHHHRSLGKDRMKRLALGHGVRAGLASGSA